MAITLNRVLGPTGVMLLTFSALSPVSGVYLVGRPRGLLGKHYRSPFFPVLPLFCVVFTALAVAADWMDPDAGREPLAPDVD